MKILVATIVLASLAVCATKLPRRLPLPPPPPGPIMQMQRQAVALDQLDRPTLLIRVLTNEEPMVNPAFSTPVPNSIYVTGNDLFLTNSLPPSPDPADTNLVFSSAVMCPVAVSLRWFGAPGHIYQVQWSTNLSNWHSTHTWRVGTGQEIEFLAPPDRAFYRLSVKPSPL